MSVLTGRPPTETGEARDDIKQVPADSATRALIRARAAILADSLGHAALPGADMLREGAASILSGLGLPREYLGFAMVALDNAFWWGAFSAVPFGRRLLLLPKCLQNRHSCRASIDSVGLHCAGCGGCVIQDLKTRAEDLGYHVIVAEGTSAVVEKVMEGEADAILGVACLDSLEKSFERIADLGVPHQALPLLTDGCQDTTAEVDLLGELIGTYAAGGRLIERSYLPLLRAAQTVFTPEHLTPLLDACNQTPPGDDVSAPLLEATQRIACDFLQRGGKRLRPFIALATYAVARSGFEALGAGADAASLLPRGIRTVAVAFEAIHKASLVHDDIEDRDPFRYGQPTIHQTYGVETAINVGDFLIGLGYRLIASQGPELGADCVADILARLAQAHLQLSSGQGAELMWNGQASTQLRPVHALQIGALKTAPAFEVALYAGLRAAQVDVADTLLRQYATFVGEGFQVLNDLTDWEEDNANKGHRGQDVLARRPTILRAFALEAGAGDALDDLVTAARASGSGNSVLPQVRTLYHQHGVFEKAHRLYGGLRTRALDLAREIEPPALRELFQFLVRNILREVRLVSD
jgi:geranylgeranyl diphosphate synthase type II